MFLVQTSWYIFRFLYFIGQISLPPGGDTFVVLPGENVTIAWKLDVSISDVLVRSWTFLPKDDRTFAEIFREGALAKNPQYSPGPFTITKPSTLLLKNVTIQYNGTYRFFVLAMSGRAYTSEVTVFVAGKCLLFNTLYLFSLLVTYSDWFRQSSSKTFPHEVYG
jgi:hypothetical protein